MCARVYRASAELLTHTEPAVLWTPSTPASLAWEGFIQRSGRNVGGQALKGQSGGGRQEPLPHTCFCERADCSVKSYRDQVQKTLLGPSSDDWALGFQRTSLPLFAHLRHLCFCDECGLLELLAKVPGVTHCSLDEPSWKGLRSTGRGGPGAQGTSV